MKRDIKIFKGVSFIWQFAKPYKFTLLSSQICIFMRSIFQTLMPLVLGILVDQALYHHNTEFFIKGSLIYAILFIGENLLMFVWLTTYQITYNKCVYDINRKLLNKVLHAKASFYDKIKTGDIQTVLNDDSGQIVQMIYETFFVLFEEAITFGFSFLLIFLINKWIALFLAALILCVFIINRYLGNKINEISQTRREAYGNYISRIYEFINGMREIRIFNAILQSKRYIASYLKQIIYSDRNISREIFKIDKMSELANWFSNIFIYIISAFFIVNGSLTIGLFLAIIQYLSKMQYEMSWFVDAFKFWQQNSVCIERVSELMNIKSELDENRSIELKVNEGFVNFENVSFAYGESELLSHISFHIKKGEKVALVGASGSGKTTIIKLLLGFYEPHKGKIKIDNTDIRNCSYKSIRNHIGFVQQDIVVFNSTILFNLTFGEPFTEEQLWHACDRAHISEKIKSLKHGFNTMIGSDGINLSGGEKQRLMIARIFLKNPKILVFDEATSSLDFALEQDITEALNEICKDKTTIIISHRLSSIVTCDKVALLKNGTIRHLDTHDNLIRNDIYYKELFNKQFFSGDNTLCS